jgi:hypothetical protein
MTTPPPMPSPQAACSLSPGMRSSAFSHLGAAERLAAEAQYEYNRVSLCFIRLISLVKQNPLQNSGLALQADRSLIDKSYKDESTGEVQTLFGQLDGSKKGDRLDFFHKLDPISFIGAFFVRHRRMVPEDTETQRAKRTKLDELNQEKNSSSAQGGRFSFLFVLFLSSTIGSISQETLCVHHIFTRVA